MSLVSPTVGAYCNTPYVNAYQFYKCKKVHPVNLMVVSMVLTSFTRLA